MTVDRLCWSCERAIATDTQPPTAGGLPLAGTGSNRKWRSAPGFGDQREIELLVESGLTAVEAIQIATENGARYLGQQDRIGTLSPGKQADLVVTKLDITKRIGWHTFRHTYSTLLRSTGAELKIMQELLRHSTIRVTLDTYTQAVTSEKRNAQEAVVALLFREKTQET